MFPPTPPIGGRSTPAQNYRYEIRMVEDRAARLRAAAYKTEADTIEQAEHLRALTVDEINAAELAAIADINRKYGVQAD